MPGDQGTSPHRPSLAPGRMRRGSWRPRRALQWVSSRSMRRAWASLMVLGLAVAFFFLLAQPFWHPRTRLIVLSPHDEVSVEAKSARYAAAQAEAWQQLAPSLDGGSHRIRSLPLEDLSTRTDELVAPLDRLGKGQQRVVILSLNAQVKERNHQAMVQTRNFRLESPPSATLPFYDLLQQIERGAPGVKLVIADLGDIATDVRDGMIINRASDQIAAAVAATKDPSIWVLASHRSGQVSHTSALLGQTVFGYFVVRGLAGDADQDRNGSVDVGELHHYVHRQVAAWVAQASGGVALQEPQLYWGGGEFQETAAPVIVATNTARPQSNLSFSQIVGLRRIELAERPSAFTRLAHLEPVAQARNSVANTARNLMPGRTLPTVDHRVRMAAQLAPQSSTAKAPAEPAPASKPAADGAEKVEPSEQAAELLLRAWQLRDELASRARHELSPVDFAPQLWREFEAMLLAAERQLRFGAPDAAPEVIAHLQRHILPLDKLYAIHAPPPDEPQTLAEQIAAAMPRSAMPTGALPSLGMAEMFAERAGTPLPAAVQQVSTLFHAWLESPNEASRDAWLDDPQTQQSATLREVHLALRLRQTPEIPAALATELLRVRYEVERLAAQPQAASPWLRSRVLEADRWTTEAERCAFDRVRPDWIDRSQLLLEQTSQSVLALSEDAVRLAAIERLWADLLYRSPQYVTLHDLPLSAGAGEQSRIDELSQLLTTLRHLNELMLAPQADRWNDLTQTASLAANHAVNMELAWQPSRLRAALDTSPKAEQLWDWKRLLTTTLIDGDSRMRMIARLPAYEGQLAERFLEPAVWWKDQTQKSQLPQLGAIEQQKTQLLRRLMLLQYGSVVPAETREVLEKTSATPQEISRALPLAVRELSASIDSAEGALQRLGYPSERAGAIRTLDLAMLAGRLIDVRDSLQRPRLPIAAALDQVHTFQVYELGYERVLAARRGVLTAEREFQESLANRYLKLASQLTGQPLLPSPATPAITVTVPEFASLMEQETVDLPVQVAAQRSYDVPVWLGIDYDHTALSVEVLGADQTTDLPQLSPAMASRAEAFKPGAEAAEFPASFVLQPSKPQDVRLRVRRLSLSEFPARIVLFSLTREDAVRSTIDLELPTRPRMQVVVRGTSGTWTQTSDELRLQPFANRQTTYELDLTSLVDQPLQGSVRLYVPTSAVAALPSGGLPVGTAQRILARYGAAEAWGVAGKLILPRRDAIIPLKFLLPEPEDDKKDAAPMAPVAAGAAAPAKDAPISLANGLIAAIHDDSLQRVSLVHFPVMPQRPSRFLRATAGYSERRQRVELRISAIDERLLPREGVKVQADFQEALKAGAQARTNDVVSGAGEVVLSGEIPPQAGRKVIVHLDVDEYPRAFTFEVPCSGEHENLAPRERVELEVARLPSGSSYRAPTATMPVELRVDLPSGTLLSSTDRLEVGIDERRDRELRQDPVVRLFSDRHAEVTLAPLAEDGLVHLTTRVGDLKVDVPTAGLQNIRANVLVRAVIGDNEYFSKPVEVMLDGAAPHFDLPQLSPSRTVSAGTEVTLSMLMIDEAQSGIDKVEVAIDAAGAGAFGEQAAPLPATLNKAGRYEVKLPTTDLAPGSYTILVRASDRVGNVSEFLPLKGLIIAGTGTEGGETTNTVTGVVQFGKRNLEGFEVTLQGEPPLELAPVISDAQGRFAIKKVPAGKYKVAARGIVRNKVSTAEVEITVKPLPDVVPSIELQVR